MSSTEPACPVTEFPTLNYFITLLENKYPTVLVPLICGCIEFFGKVLSHLHQAMKRIQDSVLDAENLQPTWSSTILRER